MQEEYLEKLGLTSGLRSTLVRAGLHYMRLWDVRSTLAVDRFLSNSHYVAARLRRTSGRSSSVVYPPVDCSRFGRITPARRSTRTFVTVSRLVPYKRVDI